MMTMNRIRPLPLPLIFSLSFSERKSFWEASLAFFERNELGGMSFFLPRIRDIAGSDEEVFLLSPAAQSSFSSSFFASGLLWSSWAALFRVYLQNGLFGSPFQFPPLGAPFLPLQGGIREGSCKCGALPAQRLPRTAPSRVFSGADRPL